MGFGLLGQHWSSSLFIKFEASTMKSIATMRLPLLILILFNSACVYCQRPAVINIGALLTFNSVIGRAAKAAMEAAVSDINLDPSVLNGTQLKLITEDTNCSVFMGSIGAFQVIEKQVVAIIGPQSSAIAHMISHIANGLRVPLISYAATDPTLSALQFPYFLRTTQSDSYQMAAMADLINFYGWKEVIAIFVDDDYGRSGVSALGNELGKKMSKISYKLPLPTQFDLGYVTDMLNKTKLLGPRVYVVHINPDLELRIFSIAQKLHMLTSNYVWLATDSLCATLDSFSPVNRASLQILKGVVALRQHIPQTTQIKAFVSRWRKMQQKGLVHSGLNAYGLYAYDTVWAVAHSVDKFLDKHGNITFSFDDNLHGMEATKMQLENLKVFDGGQLLVKILLQTNFTGLTGRVQFNANRNLVIGGYDVINFGQMAIHRVGYWSNYSGFSVLPPEALKGEQVSSSRLDQKLGNITWPGGKTEKPRGWVIAEDEKPLRIGVPNRASFKDFVTGFNHSHKIEGYCIDVFEEARKLVPYAVPYIFEPFGDGQSNPNYDELVKMVADDVLDAAVGDITIVMNRTKIVDFTQPYVASALVVVVPIRNSTSSGWVFLKPFTVQLWCATAASFVMIAAVIWILEHRVNDDFRGPPRKQLITMCLFSFSTLFKTNKDTVSALGRMVMVVWLFLLMVLTSSYTASLTSILTVQQLSSSITGIDSLITSDWPIGYQVGSFSYSYFTDILNIPRSRLVELGSPEEYERALRQGPSNGGVAAIVDEITYVELFLSKQTDFGIVGQPFAWRGWGFAFQRDSPLAVDMSTAILKLAENGRLQEINEKWFCKTGCSAERIGSSQPNQLHLNSFWALYVLCGGFALTALILFLLRTVRQYIRYKLSQMDHSTPSSSVSLSTRCSHAIYSFVHFIDEKEEAIKKKFTQRDNPQPQTS
ncbi:glutamate receptor 3.7 isoform X2 [Cornus florida]|uniref:glutamate receptor 3.7 isoform X2 n=1 Tax=Cornus florida TaxID=4283 RepID=UPI0028A0AFDB|nr:glutamate receptor 3.7 isoform X2 [Cornus florida]